MGPSLSEAEYGSTYGTFSPTVLDPSEKESTSSSTAGSAISSVSDSSKGSSAPHEQARGGGTVQELYRKALVGAAVVMWTGSLHFCVLVVLASLCYLPHPLAVASLAALAVAWVLPVRASSTWGRQVAAFVASRAHQHFPCKVIVEDPSALRRDRAYLVALEPHSVVPVASIAFSPAAGLLPQLPRVRFLASSVLAWIPLARHLWTWMGMAPASADQIVELLGSGCSCVLIPGGMQEIRLLSHDKEVIYLRERSGFVRLALETGTPLVPAFCFGQRNTYNFFIPPKWYLDLSKYMLFIGGVVSWGWCGSFMPVPTPLLVVLGRPIAVSRVLNPSKLQVAALRSRFISAMSEIYEKYKETGGQGDVPLVIV
eukprot:jgi/Mesen1/9103/ME000058S08586